MGYKVIGYDDERVKAEYEAALGRDAEWDAAMMQQQRAAERDAAWLELRRALDEFWRELWRLVEPVVEAIAAIGREALEAIEAVWELVRGGGGEGGDGRPGSGHVNCRCGLQDEVRPVVVVDKVRAGRARWWARGK